MNILVTGAWKCTREDLEQLKSKGHQVAFMQYEQEQLPVQAQWVEAVVCNGLFLHHDIRSFSNLHHIQLTSAGFDRVDVDYIRQQNIALYNARGVYSIPMAEFALCGVLQLYKQSRFFAENQKAGRWEKHRGLLELYGKTVAVIGCGNIGQECAKRFEAFGCRVIGADVFEGQVPGISKVCHISCLEQVLQQSDVVVLTLPHTEQTHHLMNSKTLKQMKKGAILVNIARGGVVDTAALEQALQDHLGGAVLDVFEQEPLPEESELWQMDQVILTPHNSFIGDGNGARLSRVILSNF